ncbi:cation:proton antiporter [Azohydromonas caseinilytica]|uniref:Sodium:proton exchanger n=1 Tax=Azohydromonas caseinilytica TaxID=2728836 RepID=A0A848F4S5_9BURK|nr:cation:proton antiporter [Azohydromonas caseinilytica]NML14078.1 sodium:proton exchanger [Azohydromonas caseinilytica]
MNSLVTAPWDLSPDTLLGATLVLILAALLGEGLWRLLHWPRLMGYGAVGTVLAIFGGGASGSETALRLVVDMALALLLFEAGARLNLRWLLRNPALLATSILESLLTALAVYALAAWLEVPHNVAVVLAFIAVSVSPAVVQRVIGESDAAGQVTERLSTLSALNTLYAVLLLKALSAGLRLGNPGWEEALLPVLVGFAGSIVLGALLGSALGLIARRLDLRQDNAVALLLGCVLLALAVAKTLQLSTLLVPLLAGIWLRNRHPRPWVWRRQFGSAGGVLVMVLFVTAASAWSPAKLPEAIGVAAALLGARALAKLAAVALLAPASGLSWRQAGCLGATLLPMSATAWLLALDFAALHPASAADLMPLLLSMLALLELPAPLVLLYGLRLANEAEVHEQPR